MDVHRFWAAILAQDAHEIRKYFHQDAYINWHCTNEHFSVDDFIVANCTYPGTWDGKVERVEARGDLVITATLVYPKDRSASYHVTSFIQIINNKIVAMDEYWADDGPAPPWRAAKKIGSPIK